MKQKRKLDIKNIISFYRKTPKNILILFFSFLIFIPVQYYAQYTIPIIQKKFIDISIMNKMINKEFLIKIIVFVLIYIFITFIIKIISVKLNNKFYSYLYYKNFLHILFIEKENIETMGIGHYLNILHKDTEFVSGFLTPSIFSFLISIIQVFFVFRIIYIWNNVISFIYISSLLISVIVSYVFVKVKTYYFHKMRITSADFSQINYSLLSNTFSIKFFNRLKMCKSTLKSVLKKMMNVFYRFYLTLGLGDTVFNIIKYLTTIIVIIYGIILIINNDFTYGSLIAILSYSAVIFMPIDNFFDIFSKLSKVDVSLKIIKNNIYKLSKLGKIDFSKSTFLNEPLEKMEFIDIEYKYNNKNNKDNNKNPEISVTSLNNEYNNLNIQKLKNKTKKISFTINKGEIIGLVGLSGEGKSSILKMLYLDRIVKNGEIKINNYNIQNITNYYGIVNHYPQDTEIFNEDLIFNLTLGKKIIKNDNKKYVLNRIYKDLGFILNKIDNIINKKKYSNFKKFKLINGLIFKNSEYIDLFELIGFTGEENPLSIDNYINYLKKTINKKDKFLKRLTYLKYSISYCSYEKLNSLISELNIKHLIGRKLGDNGEFISGGEKQKVCFARFLLKENSEFFTIDEPFTSLDSVSEKKAIEIAKNYLKKKTGIIISHKLNIIYNLATSIIVIDKGQIVQKGSHKELSKKPGLYRELLKNFIDQRELE